MTMMPGPYVVDVVSPEYGWSRSTFKEYGPAADYAHEVAAMMMVPGKPLELKVSGSRGTIWSYKLSPPEKTE